MSSIALSGNAAGAGVFTIASPNSASSYTATLPTATTTLVGTDATQTLTNKTIQGGAITSGTAVASTSGTSIDFTGIPSWVKRITVMLNSISTNSTGTPMIRLGAGSIEATGYTGSVTRTTSGGNGVANLSTGFNVSDGSAAAQNWSGQMVLTHMGGNLYCVTGAFGGADAARNSYVAGVKTLSGTLDRVRITTDTGTDTFDAGSINILYEG